MKYGMLVNYGLCIGCQSCEISCVKEKNLPEGEWGIKVEQIGPEKLGGKWEWDYVPVPSSLCDLCEERMRQGKQPSCQLHCLAKVIEVLPLDEMSKRMQEISDHKVACYLP